MKRRVAFGLLNAFLVLSIALEIWRWTDPDSGWLRTVGSALSLVGVLTSVLLIAWAGDDKRDARP